jgi:hypoxanthine phosphoribosyltransferase
MKTNKLTLSWKDIEQDCATVAHKLKKEKVDLIVAITKGGLPPAVILANKYLGKPHIITLQLEEIVKEKKAGYLARKVSLISPLNTYPIKGKSLLIVDDVADTGQTLAKAIELVASHKPTKITTATLHYKPRSKAIPHIYARKIPNHTWIIYPWE